MMFTIPLRICIFVLAVTGLVSGLHETSLVSRWVRECPDGHQLSRISSTYHWNRGTSDRKWILECEPSPLRLYACFWTPDVNGFDQDVNFDCKNGIIAGMEASGYGRTSSDRKFAFRCCEAEAYLGKEYTTDYINEYGKDFSYTVKSGEFITGVYSHHRNGAGYEDRQWKFDLKKKLF
ncbi:dermatopontin-like [Dendronephthya gigantea]|uniref:dermatopontin-like n=1 Tax=Dendronephthya gigantea TaxID=151771 RepID=UPI001069BB4C|nr:dermatopontin-like [Dendronephthya gigantea]